MLFGLPDVTIKKLERLQHAAARLILNRSWRGSATEMLKELHWLSGIGSPGGGGTW